MEFYFVSRLPHRNTIVRMYIPFLLFHHRTRATIHVYVCTAQKEWTKGYSQGYRSQMSSFLSQKKFKTKLRRMQFNAFHGVGVCK